MISRGMATDLPGRDGPGARETPTQGSCSPPPPRPSGPPPRSPTPPPPPAPPARSTPPPSSHCPPASPLLQRHRRDQRRLDRHIVPRHHHLNPLRELDVPRHVRRPKVKLRPVPAEKRRVPPPPPPPQHLHLRLKPRVRLDRPRLRQHHPPLHFVPLNPPQQHPNVVPRHRFVEHLPKHLNPRRHRPLRLRP